VTPRELQRGDVVQLAPSDAHALSGCFMLVTDPRPWGAMGYVAVPGERGTPPGMAYFRAEWSAMEYVGGATWVRGVE
jgi:hypothetical protein